MLGWYLMVPPTIPNTRRVNKSAPLRDWKVQHVFAHNQGCEAAKHRVVARGEANQAQREGIAKHARFPDLECVLCQAQCVEDSDPRLKAD
jgi:hypothetical protein